MSQLIYSFRGQRRECCCSSLIMVRICLTAPTKIELSQDASGRYHATGPGGGDLIQLFIGMTEKLLANESISYRNSDTQERCMEELKGNKSDISSVLRFLDENPQDYNLPVVMADSRIEFTTGYTISNLSSKHSKESTAISNFTLLDPYVQVTNVLLFVLMAACVVTRCILHWRTDVILRRKNTLTLKSEVKKEVNHLFYASSSKSRWISFLFAVLTFYLITSFMISYKTSHVVMDKPYMVTSYSDLLKDKTSLPVFWNFLYSKSDLFKGSPENSLRARVWEKLVKSGNNMQDHIHGSFDMERIDFLNRVFHLMSQSHYIFIGSTEDIQIWRGLICAMSTNEQLRRLFVFSDESEQPRLAGLPVSKFYPRSLDLQKALARVTEVGLFRLLFLEAKGLMMRMMFQIFQADPKHQYLQTLACDDDFKLKEDTTVSAITLNYFVSFFYATLVIIAFATFALSLEQFGWRRRRVDHSVTHRSGLRESLRHRPRMAFYRYHSTSQSQESPSRLISCKETNQFTFHSCHPWW